MILSGANLNISGFVFDIQGFSVHDGPGCRTLIFLQGCTLDCFWCSNPEGISTKPSLMYFSSKCNSDGNCVISCPYNALKLENSSIQVSRDICLQCKNKECLEACLTNALRISSYEISTQKVFEVIQRDQQFWGSKGGITLTGGEPLLQIDFAKSILQLCYDNYIHTAIETCGNIPWENFKLVLPFIDWIFFDLKNIDNAEHKKATGAGNKIILENAIKLSQEFKGRLVFRIPVIPNYNNTMENIESTIKFIKETGRNEVNLLPIHHFGREKYYSLNKKYLAEDYSIPSKGELERMKDLFEKSGISCYIGADTPF